MAAFTVSSQSLYLRNPKSSSYSMKPPKPLNFTRTYLPSLKTRVSSSTSSPTISPPPSLNSRNPFNSTSTRTVTSLIATFYAVSKLLFSKFASQIAISAPTLSSAGPLFFAAVRDRSTGYLNTPLTVVAAGMCKWLDIYSGVLMVRVLLSWFPNIPWDRQPLSAIRDLCDPYLNLFRNIIPPVFDTLDISPLFAFAVLGTLGAILNNSRRGGF
ncbi:ylmG homolog protein 1-2, chloroplastic-like [Amaranthus tricolor]|uniref:ylmG homolog protein 1-2, chloroplastic-like n=1 Tax=Amaranthus tricolor TaxID=29722 RepID=UPI00258E17C7|nr:ylmG homolog protein 1-2, chloroplastic-like [Amaranthus tricolor]